MWRLAFKDWILATFKQSVTTQGDAKAPERGSGISEKLYGAFREQNLRPEASGRASCSAMRQSENGSEYRKKLDALAKNHIRSR
jgi:hypothetical protein